MRRCHFIELHEQPWLPSSIRDEITDVLQFGLNLFNAYRAVTPVLQRALESTGSRSVVDLCSGGGGPWLELFRELQSKKAPGVPMNFQVCLTDQYPNLMAFERAKAASGGRITFYPGPVDVREVPAELKGFRTLFTAFHHFLPDDALAILRNATAAGEGVGVFEVTRRAPSTMILIFAWVFALIVCMPWVRPFRWSLLLWMYLVPIIPLVLLFDGVVSCLRTYRPDELREMVGELEAPGYRWEIDELAGVLPVTYLIGIPPKSS